ncbi:hypothetical protein CHELA1G11_20595 [Hyphomicrobiales bacterium]|nr:hypothetical protein CHELA1G11_20595 [Hyphomicrobiales bacterium]CAH1690979.1 hypothetical protein CHELA1G2_20911 [Hyphomicrobiales bacterium]
MANNSLHQCSRWTLATNLGAGVDHVQAGSLGEASIEAKDRASVQSVTTPIRSEQCR